MKEKNINIAYEFSLNFQNNQKETLKATKEVKIEIVKKEIKHVSILEAQFKSVKTNLRFRNFQGTLTQEQVDATYNATELLTAEHVASKIIEAMENNLEKVLIQ